MNKILITLITTFIFLFSSGQAPGIRWQRTLGGTVNDVPSFSCKTIDNGFITVTQTFSNNGDISGNHGGSDIWIVKMNILGQTQWTRTIGGASNETPVSYYYNTDGSFLIVSNTISNNGDVSGNHGGNDIWVSKLAADGTSLWHKCFGGSGEEYVSNIIKAVDGSYVISGLTMSNNGDVSGNHGGQDLWVFDINETGTLQWQAALGGTLNEVISNAKVIQALDGSYYIGTETLSNNGNVTGNAGSRDMWLVKLNSTGVFQWQKCMGGTSTENFTDLKEGQNGEMYVCGFTNSPGLPNFHGINTDYSDLYLCRVSSAGALLSQKCYGGTLSDAPTQLVSTFPDGSCIINSTIYNGGGDIVGYHGVASGNDIWIFKLKNDGTIEWQRALGSFGFDGMIGSPFDGYGGSGNVIQTSDQGYLIGAYTESGGGDVTGYHTPPVFDSSSADIWIIKLSSGGVLEWQRCLGGYSGEWARGSILEMATNDYIVTGYTNSTYGDVQTNNGLLDAWIVRLASVNTVTGLLYYDQNSNGIKDPGESTFSNATVKTEKPGDTRIAVPIDGLFKTETDIGDYTTTVQLSLPYYSVIPTSHLSSFTTYFNKDSFSFAIQPIPGIKDLVINVIPLSVARPGFNVSYNILYKNIGTDPVTSGEILFKKDTRLNFVSSVPAISSSNGDTLKWNYSNLDPLDSASITVKFLVQSPPMVNIGDTLTSIGIITPVAGDQTPVDDTVIVKQIVRGSFDPNDKYEKNEGKVFKEYVTTGKYFDYLIRFQNLGTDTAFNIVILDTLSTKLDLSSLQVIATSHSYKLSLTNNILTWTFYDIKLPYSSINEPASHGYIAYRIKPLNSVALGDTIHNTASIYFDFNLPVQTNNAFTVVQDNVALGLDLLSFTGVYRAEKTTLQWTTTNEVNIERFEIQRSFTGTDFGTIGQVMPHGRMGTVAQYEFIDLLNNISASTFFYRLLIREKDGKISYSKILLFKRVAGAGNSISINPNPVTGISIVNVNYTSQAWAEFRVVDMNGKIVLKQRNTILQGNNSINIAGMEKLGPGFYLLQALIKDHKLTAPFIIK
jgi:hypothetical protein